MIVPQVVILAVCYNYLPSIELIEAAENGWPREPSELSQRRRDIT
jgi:hypothetical protein